MTAPSPSSGRPAPGRAAAAARRLAAASLALLMAALAGGILGGDTPPLLLIPALLPLLIFVPAVCRGSPRGLAALCFVCLLYFCVIMTRLFAPDAAPFDGLALLAVVALFISAMLGSRWRRRELGGS